MTSSAPNSPSKVALLTTGVLALLALLLSYLYPFHQLPFSTFFNEWLFAVFVGLGVAWVYLQGSLRWANPVPWLLVLCLVALHAWLWGPAGPMQQTLLVGALLFGVVGWVAYSLGLNLQQSPWLGLVLGMVWLAAVVSAVVAILQWSGVVAAGDWDPGFILFSEGGGRVASNIGQANNLGTLLVMGLAVVGYAWYAEVSRPAAWRAIALASVVLLVLGIYFSGSRTAKLNLLLWPVLLFAWARIRGGRRWPWLALAPMALLLVLEWALPPLIQAWGLFPAQEARSLVADSSRPRLWMMVASAISEHPWLGHGFGAVANSQLVLSPEYGSLDNTIARHAHNTVLDMWITFGLPLGSLIVGSFVWAWIKAWRASTSVQTQFLWLMTTAMGVHAMLEYPLNYGFFFWLLCLLLGVLGGVTWREHTVVHRFSGILGWMVVFSLAAYPVWRAYVDTESVYTTFRLRSAAMTRAALEGEKDTLASRLYPEPLERLRWLTMPVDDVLQLSPQGVAELENFASFHPLPGVGWRVAFAYGAQGNADKAAWWAERMCSMFSKGSCGAAQKEWAHLAESHPHWPALPWDKWLPANPPQQ